MSLPLSDAGRVTTLLTADEQRGSDVFARTAFVPERQGEMVPPDRLESRDLIEDLYEIGHDRKVRFFEHERGKSARRSQDGALEIMQHNEAGARVINVHLSEAGELVLNAPIGERDLGERIRSFFSILEEDVKAALVRSFAFAARAFDRLDPYERYSAMWVGSALVGVENRYLYPQSPTGSSAPVRMSGERLVVAENQPRKLTRAQIRSPEAEIRRLITRFRQHIGVPTK
jgi:hypothetical protein